MLVLLGCAPPAPPPPPVQGPLTTTEIGTTPPVPGCPLLTDLGVSTSPGNLLERRFHLELDGDAAVFATCAAEAEPEELHLAESTVPAAEHDLVVRGLLAGVRYTCDLRAVCGGPRISATFTPQGPPLPAFEATSSGDGPTGAYTLFNTQRKAYSVTGSWVVIVDPDARPRWACFAGTNLVADIDAELEDGGTTVHFGGGWAYHDAGQPNRGVFRDVDLSGNVLLDHAEPVFGHGYNHHSEKRDDGSYLSLTSTTNELGDAWWYGVGIEHWHPDEGLVWTWTSQQLVDAGLLGVPEGSERTPYHANSVSFVDDAWGGAAWVSLYAAREIWRLDRATGDRTHVFGATGDLTLLDADGEPLGDEDWTWVQHDPDYAEDGRVLMYDNGQDRPGGARYSRVVEYRLDLDARTATLLWDWTEDGWYDPTLGDADYLPNGHVLITRGFNSSWTPESDDVSQIIELRPPDEVLWRMKWTSPDWPTFRAQRYDGCEVFANARYCPAIADRVAELQAELGP